MRDAVGLVYSNKEKNSNKFFIVWSYRCSVNVNWGRLGQDGGIREYKFETKEEGIEFREKKIKEKIKKGYIKYPIEKISRHNKNEYLCEERFFKEEQIKSSFVK